MPFAILITNENVACAATYGGGGFARIGCSQMSGKDRYKILAGTLSSC